MGVRGTRLPRRRTSSACGAISSSPRCTVPTARPEPGGATAAAGERPAPEPQRACRRRRRLPRRAPPRRPPGSAVPAAPLDDEDDRNPVAGADVPADSEAGAVRQRQVDAHGVEAPRVEGLQSGLAAVRLADEEALVGQLGADGGADGLVVVDEQDRRRPRHGDIVHVGTNTPGAHPAPPWRESVRRPSECRPRAEPGAPRTTT